MPPGPGCVEKRGRLPGLRDHRFGKAERLSRFGGPKTSHADSDLEGLLPETSYAYVVMGVDLALRWPFAKSLPAFNRKNPAEWPSLATFTQTRRTCWVWHDTSLWSGSILTSGTARVTLSPIGTEFHWPPWLQPRDGSAGAETQFSRGEL